MKVALVKHGNCGKVYWFEVPERLSDDVVTGVRVTCDTARGKKTGVVVDTAVLDPEQGREVLSSAGAVLPLRQILSVEKDILMADIKIPDYMKRSAPRDDKIAKRFLEYYHTMRFNTNVSIREDGTLVDGYSAYLVAKMLNLPFLSATVKQPKPAEDIPF